MIQIQRFTFNPFQENTYVLYDDQQNCIVVDPGCYEVHEQEALEKIRRSTWSEFGSVG